jgi:hypothetical protein
VSRRGAYASAPGARTRFAGGQPRASWRRSRIAAQNTLPSWAASNRKGCRSRQLTWVMSVLHGPIDGDRLLAGCGFAKCPSENAAPSVADCRLWPQRVTHQPPLDLQRAALLTAISF